MAKYDAMIKKNKKKMEDRIRSIDEACNQIINDNKDITYKKVSELTRIPLKTLYRDKYKEEINKWISEYNDRIMNNEIDIYVKEIEYLKKIIKKLREQNNNLKLELYTMYKR